MNAPLAPEVLLLREDAMQTALPLATPGIQRWVWEGRYGRMLIEVAGGEIYVNSQRVEPHPSAESAAAQP
jgi:hypothetical protein